MDNVERPRRLLSLDGGGIRGLSSIMILEHLMDRINEGCDEKKEPWQVFNIIGGTSTGEFIAIMLGRLHFTIEECKDAYLKMSERILTPNRSSLNPWNYTERYFTDKGKFSATELEECDN